MQASTLTAPAPRTVTIDVILEQPVVVDALLEQPVVAVDVITGQVGSPGQGVPIGGTDGQVLTKLSGADFDTAWMTLPPYGYRHVQAAASTVWFITHNLSHFRPNVSAVDSTGREMIPGEVDYTSATSLTLTFSAAVGGEAYLS